MQRSEKSPEHHQLRVQHVDRASEGDSEKVELPLDLGRDARRIGAEQRAFESFGIRLPQTKRLEQGASGYFGLERSRDAARIGRVARAHPGVAEFAGVACDTPGRPAADDQAAADSARAAVEVDHVGHTACGAEVPLGRNAQVCVVGGNDRQAGRPGEQLADGFVDPAEVRCVPHKPVDGAHEPGNGDADSYDPVGGGQLGAQRRDHAGGNLHGLGRTR